MKLAMLAASALAATLTFGAVGARAQVVLTDNFNADAPGLNSLGGDTVFTVTAGSVDVIPEAGMFGLSAQPGHGEYIDLDGSVIPPTGGIPAGQITSVGAFSAGTYTLTFDLAGNLRASPPQTTVVSLGSTTIAALTPTATTDFTAQSFTFTTTGGKLVFTENSPGDNIGNLLDNVKLTSAAPEPSTWALMILGVGLVGASLRRKAFGGMALSA